MKSLRPERNDLYTPEAVRQRRLRIRLAVAAYAYEFDDTPIMSDEAFDRLSREVDVEEDTGAPDLDWFFLEEFDPSTGNWIHKHPELEQVKNKYLYLKQSGMFDV